MTDDLRPNILRLINNQLRRDLDRWDARLRMELRYGYVPPARDRNVFPAKFFTRGWLSTVDRVERKTRLAVFDARCWVTDHITGPVDYWIDPREDIA